MSSLFRRDVRVREHDIVTTARLTLRFVEQVLDARVQLL
jgi:hypothetical protein